MCSKTTGPNENRTRDNATWSGYTFLKLKETEISDDGSFERVDP